MKQKRLALIGVLNIYLLLTMSCVGVKGTQKRLIEAEEATKIQFIRNATVKISFQHTKVLIDPILADEGTEAPIPFSNTIKNPTIDLPFDKYDVIKDVNAILLTHYHADHFDAEAERILPKNILIFCQPGDDHKLKEKGFNNVQVIQNTFNWRGITISRFSASHHKGATGEMPFGESSSFNLQNNEENIFITGDAIFDEKLKTSLSIVKPSIIIANTGECQFTEPNPVLKPHIEMTLTKSELKQIVEYFPLSRVIAVHMDAINHCSLTKVELDAYIEKEKLTKRILIPREGDILLYSQVIK